MFLVFQEESSQLSFINDDNVSGFLVFTKEITALIFSVEVITFVRNFGPFEDEPRERERDGKDR
jgi:hypothetical protein